MPRCRRRGGRGPPRRARRPAKSRPPSSAAPRPHVAVAVRRRPSPRPSARRPAASAPDVGADRVEVDLDPGGSVRLIAHPCLHARRRGGQALGDVARERPLARDLDRRGRRRDRGRYAPAHAASKGSSPRARRPPIAPVRTSPGAGGRQERRTSGIDPRRAPRCGDRRVRRALHQRDRAGAAASGRRARRRCPVARCTPDEPRNSPTCGVRTASRLAIAQRLGRRPSNAFSPSASRTRDRRTPHQLRTKPRSRSCVVSPDRSPARRRPRRARAAVSSAPTATVPSAVSGSGTKIASVSAACTAGSDPTGAATVDQPGTDPPLRSGDQRGRAGHRA